MSVFSNIGDWANFATIIASLIALFGFIYQFRSFVSSKTKIYNDVAEWQSVIDTNTGDIFEEIVVIRCVNSGSITTAIENARFEIMSIDDQGEWDLIDVVPADRETQLSMPIRVGPAETARLLFTFDRRKSAEARENRILYVQKIMGEKRETKLEVSLSNGNFMFLNEKTAK